jgi:hypothetical protein
LLICILEQDEDLDELHGHILNIKYAGQAIGKEADVHNKLLDNLEDDVRLNNQFIMNKHS